MALHTDIPTRSELDSLIEARDPASVSIYLPTTVLTQDVQADRIELKTRTSEAADRLAAAGVDPRAVGRVREEVEALAEDDDFWEEQARTLAVFATPERVRTFRLPNRLSPTVEVGDRFYVTPLLRAVTFPQAAFVLARAATYGAVDTVFVDIDEQVSGHVDDESGAVTLTDGDAANYDVIDEIVRRVLLSGGRVLAVRRADVPRGGPVGAIMRYAV